MTLLGISVLRIVNWKKASKNMFSIIKLIIKLFVEFAINIVFFITIVKIYMVQ